MCSMWRWWGFHPPAQAGSWVLTTQLQMTIEPDHTWGLGWRASTRTQHPPTLGIREREYGLFLSHLCPFPGQRVSYLSRGSADLNSLLTTSTLLSTDWKGQDHLQVPGFISLGDNPEPAGKMSRYRQGTGAGQEWLRRNPAPSLYSSAQAGRWVWVGQITT